jgi:hypothetical protein
VDQADVREVVRHLVDEARRVGLAVDPGALDVVLAERTQCIGSSAASVSW